jgi:TRAP-type C4-dicarboxylate transport system substrate-binding protein
MSNSTVKFFSIASVILVLFSFAKMSSAADPTFKLKYASHSPPMHATSILSEEWCREIEKRTGGRVKVTYYPGGSLVKANQMYDSVVKGITDVGFGVLGYTPGRFPLSEVFALPLGFKSALQAARCINAYQQKFKPKEFDEVEVMYLHNCGPGRFHCKNPITKLDDLKGNRFKGSGYTLRIVEALGGTPTDIPIVELYDSVKRGVTDGAFLPMETLKGFKLVEVCPYTYSVSAGNDAPPFFVAMNKATWNSLPKDIQQIIDKLNKEFIEKQGKLWDNMDAEGIEYAEKYGHKFVKATPEDNERARVELEVIINNYLKNMRDKALPGDEVLKFVNDWIESRPAK